MRALGGMLDYNLANAGGALIGFEARTPDPRFQHSGSGAARRTRAGRSTTRFSSNSGEADVRWPPVQRWPTPTRARRTRARQIPAAPPAAANPTCRTPDSWCRATQRNLDANYALSDFDRPHRFSGSFVWDLPGQGACDGFRVRASSNCSPVCRTRSSPPSPSSPTRHSTAIWSADRAASIASGSAVRACAVRSTSSASTATTRPRRRSTRACCARRSTSAGGYPGNLGFGNLGRNVLRGFWQRRVDLSLAKAFSLGGSRNFELRWDVFNVFNTVNYALPNNVIGERHHRLRQDHRFDRRTARDAAGRPSAVLASLEPGGNEIASRPAWRPAFGLQASGPGQRTDVHLRRWPADAMGMLRWRNLGVTYFRACDSD